MALNFPPVNSQQKEKSVSYLEENGITQRKSYPERFPFDCPQIEAAVVTHKSYNGFELAVDKRIVIARHCDTNGGDKLAVVVLNLGNGNIKPALQPADYALDDAALLF
jgi:hypothetical protein